MIASPSSAPWRALPILLSGTFMALLDVFVVNVAAPDIRADLGASPAAVQWIVAGYVLPYAVLLITGGRIGDVTGRRRAFRAGMAVFTAASALCAAAPSAGALVAARVLQGIGGALMTPQVLAIIQVEFAPSERPRCMAWFGGVVGAASVCGQLVGGALIALDVLGLGWRAVFLVNVPIGIAAIAAAKTRGGGWVPESRAEGVRRLDIGGVALSAATLLLVVAPLVEGREAGWPWWVPASLAAAVAGAAAWVAHERRVTARGGAPLVDLELLRFGGFRAGLALVLAMYAAAPPLFLVLAFFVQTGHGLSALQSAGVYTPLAVSFVAASFAAPALLRRHGHAALTPAALVSATAALALAAVVAASPGDLPLAGMCAALFVMGCGQGIVMPSSLGITLQTVPGRFAGAASGVLAMTQQVGNALGVAAAGAIYFGILGDAPAPSDYANAFAAAALWTAAGAACAAWIARGVSATALRDTRTPSIEQTPVRAGR